jgi:hypothetical protein
MNPYVALIAVVQESSREILIADTATATDGSHLTPLI